MVSQCPIIHVKGGERDVIRPTPTECHRLIHREVENPYGLLDIQVGITNVPKVPLAR